jgi:hypothetical protein
MTIDKLIEIAKKISFTNIRKVMEEENIQENIKHFSDEKLCEIIVSNRYLGVLRDAALACMDELSARRVAGNVFPYEKRIEELLASLPKINIDLKSIMNPNKLGRII